MLAVSITALQNRLYDVVNLSLQTMTVPETSIGFSIRQQLVNQYMVQNQNLV